MADEYSIRTDGGGSEWRLDRRNEKIAVQVMAGKDFPEAVIRFFLSEQNAYEIGTTLVELSRKSPDKRS